MSLREWVRRQYGAYLRHTLSVTPDHVAVIQDGNRRYAESRGLEQADGHARGAETTESLLEWCLELDISTVTLYTFSTENFNRPAAERTSLFDLITEKLYTFADADRIHENEVSIRGLGAIGQLPTRLQEAVAYAESETESYDQLQLNIALAYGGRQELLQAARRVAESVTAGKQAVDAITTDTVEAALYQESLPDVDLLVRTGGNQRTSNFLPWHAVGAASAVYFTDAYWPAFSRCAFLRSLQTYAAQEQSFRRRQRERAKAIAAWFRREDSAATPSDTKIEAQTRQQSTGRRRQKGDRPAEDSPCESEGDVNTNTVEEASPTTVGTDAQRESRPRARHPSATGGETAAASERDMLARGE